jgi:hypothetical protein
MQTLQNTPFTRFHGDDTGSNPVGDANLSLSFFSLNAPLRRFRTV